MSDLIDGLSPQAYTLLQSPRVDEPPIGNLAHRIIRPFELGFRWIGTFFVRLFFAVFVTHRWETDASLRDHIWSDLSTKDKLQNPKLNTIKAIVDSLKIRLSGDDQRIEQIENKLNNSQASPAGAASVQPTHPAEGAHPFSALVAKVNDTNQRPAERLAARDSLAAELCQLNDASITQAAISALDAEEDKAFVNSGLKITGILGVNHPFLQEPSLLPLLCSVFPGSQSQPSEDVKNKVIEDLAKAAVLRGLDDSQKALLGVVLAGELFSTFETQYLNGFEALDTAVVQYVSKLSENNPMNQNITLLAPFYFLNQFGLEAVDGQIAKILGLVYTLQNPSHQDEVTALIKDEGIKRTVRIAAGLLKDGDLVADYSQGRIEDFAQDSSLKNSDAKNACGSICAEAMFYLMQGGDINSEKVMYRLIENGALAHRARGYGTNQVVFGELVEKINGEGDKLRAYVLKNAQDDGVAKLRSDSPLEYPYQRTISQGMGDLVDLMGQMSLETNQRLYGVLTCGAETILFYHNADGTLSLFDSHGKKYQEVAKGASLRRFQSKDELVQRIQKMYEPDAPFSLWVIGTAQS